MRGGLCSAAVALGVGAACAQPPTEELAMVVERIEDARGVDADIFAPDLLREAESGLAEAERLVRVERDHREAIRAAGEATFAAEDAFTKASSARAATLRRFERLEAELLSLLEMAASRGAGEEELRAYRERCDLASAVAVSGDVLGALEMALALKPELLAVEQRYR